MFKIKVVYSNVLLTWKKLNVWNTVVLGPTNFKRCYCMCYIATGIMTVQSRFI
jgi:hypothetical protein